MPNLTFGSVELVIDQQQQALESIGPQNEGATNKPKFFGWIYLNQFSNIDGNYIKITSKDERTFEITRDKFGSIPIYYNDALTLFSTDKRHLIDKHAEGFKPTGLSEYVACGFTTFRNTVYEGVNVLSPFEGVLIEDGKASIVSLGHYFPNIDTQCEPNEGIQKCMAGAVRGITKAFPAVTLNFSGGNDSTLLLGLLRQIDPTVSIRTNTYFHTDWRDELNDWEYADELSKAFGTKHELCKIDQEVFSRASAELSKLTRDAMHTYSSAFFYQNSSVIDGTPIINGSGPDECIVGTEKSTVKDMLRINDRTQQEWLQEVFFARDYFKLGNTELRSLIGNSFEEYTTSRNATALSLINDKTYVDFQRKFHALIILQDHIRQLTQVASALNKQIIFPFLTDEFFKVVFSADFRQLNAEGIYKNVIKEQLRGLVDDRYIHRPKIGFQSPSRRYFSSDSPMRQELTKRVAGKSEVFDLKKLKSGLQERLAGQLDLRERYDFLEWTSLNILRLEQFHDDN